ncbi:pyridine nucleotide-disulfide oxidoreductase [Magnetospirillum sp. ME-1]|uniref:NAD(P)/FAD-dependent oxidoreductase n=1 Tax=Magnetospirillum sp. ME-1 TaxID=1639348 RepID=UPI000A17DFCD|nr:FAD-dependent oxidoreductase [Magnetospirillum sp. ME-1]ARJ68248.1 pyridine nucleotide-disulfide oxidoreductase [Magnetospirillum sp. ME-1]
MHHVIVGAGPAGVTAAETIRELDPGAAITLVGDEPEPPYSRMAIPYLLTGKVGEEGTYLRKGPNHYERLGITLMPGRRMTGLDPKARRIALDGGETLAYDRLLLALGARPLRPAIEGLDLPGIHTCWTLADARRIAALAVPGSHVVLLGAGFVGTIVLEALALRQVSLTVVEMGDRMVPRMMDEVAGGMLKRWCEAKGVRVLTGTAIRRIAKAASPAAEARDSLVVELSDGSSLPAHLVVVSAGVRSNTEILAGSGIDLDHGILVNDHMRTSLAEIYAAGDVAQGRDFISGEAHVHAIQITAAAHGRVAAHNMTGNDQAYHGSLNMNVLDTLGLITCSFGAWQGNGGDCARLVDEAGFRYLRLEFDGAGDVVIGAQAVGTTDHVGALRGLIQSKRRLGAMKEKLLADPARFMTGFVQTLHR